MNRSELIDINSVYEVTAQDIDLITWRDIIIKVQYVGRVVNGGMRNV
jgi:hypothetical protein